VAGCFREARPAATCVLGDRPCDGRKPCAAHLSWASVREQMHAPLRRTTLADLLADRSHEQSLAGEGAGTHGRAARAA
jgi:DNA-binding IscR family transcriptional regulator